MWKTISLLLIIGTSSIMAQRPSYAGSAPIGYPELAVRFRDMTSSTEATTVDLANRFGEATSPIPVDALGDSELVNRLNSWPREHRPFWLLNYEAIEAARRQSAQATLQTRGNFQGLGNDDSVPLTPSNQRNSFLSTGRFN